MRKAALVHLHNSSVTAVACCYSVSYNISPSSQLDLLHSGAVRADAWCHLFQSSVIHPGSQLKSLLLMWPSSLLSSHAWRCQLGPISLEAVLVSIGALVLNIAPSIWGSLIAIAPTEAVIEPTCAYKQDPLSTTQGPSCLCLGRSYRGEHESCKSPVLSQGVLTVVLW